MAGPSSRPRTSTAWRPARCASRALCRLPALHAGPARHPLRRARLPLAALGVVEIWEDAITAHLRRRGRHQLITDHPHLFETGGENYHVDFTAWDYQRGHEGDAWKTRPDPSWAGAPSLSGAAHMPYDDQPRVVSRRGGLSRVRAPWPPRALDRGERRSSRALLPDGRRVRSARAVRHPRALCQPLRPGLGGPAPDLAALCGGRAWQRACSSDREGAQIAPATAAS